MVNGKMVIIIIFAAKSCKLDLKQVSKSCKNAY